MLCEVNGHVTHQLEIDHRLGAQPAPTSKLKLVHLVRLAIMMQTKYLCKYFDSAFKKWSGLRRLNSNCNVV